MQLTCPTYGRGTPEYESVRRSVVWNGLKPERYPETIVQVNTEADVVAAVKYAAVRGMKIGVRSGGHSWTASFLRESGMLIDVSRLNDITVDEHGIATVGPGAYGGSLNRKLSERGYMFPGGHCPTVGLGGYLLQGGFGWNSRLYGTGCENVLAVDVVTADGTVLHASRDQNQDLLWAARGAGHGFFGVVTRFHLRCHPLPGSIMNSRFWLPIEDLDKVLTSLDNAQDSFPLYLEVSVFIGYEQEGVPGLTVLVRGDSLAESRADAEQSLETLHQIPVLSGSMKADLFQNLSLDILLDNIGDLLEVSDHNHIVDNTWMDAPLATILPQIHTMVGNLAPAPAHLYLLYFNRKGHQLEDMAFSLEGRVYISYFAIFKDSRERLKWAQTIAEGIRSIAYLGPGSQLADENLFVRPSRFMAPQNFRRLELLRHKYDPCGRFHGFMRIPDEFRELEVKS